MSQPWHTEGYLILSSVLLYLAAQNSYLSVDEQIARLSHDEAIGIIRDAGKEIRREYETLS